LKLDSFFRGDVTAYVDAAPKDQAVAMFPPYFPEGYETMFKHVHEVFDWPEPDYAVFTEASIASLFTQVAEFKHWAIGTNHPELVPEELAGNLRATIQRTGKDVPMFLYCSDGPVRLVKPMELYTKVVVPRLAADDELDGELALGPINRHQFATLRAQYLNTSISPTKPQMAYVVMVGGKMVGAFAVMPNGETGVYMMCDFAISGTKHKRLSKLVVAASLSKETQHLLQQYLGRAVPYVFTTAFSDRPQSMKYRGLMQLRERAPGDVNSSGEPGTSGKKYRLQYKALAGQYTLAEAFATWKEKNGKAAGGA
jgi:hypothetical protein